MRGAKPEAARSEAIAALVREATILGAPLPDTAVTRFEVYIDTLLVWRRRLSLTAAATALEIVREHILDSLPLCRFVQPGMRVADLGSGGGFPGIPLAILCDHARVSLVESRRKKASFLREAVRLVGLTNTEVLEGRAEDLAQSAAWDIVVSRAVWALPEFLNASEPLLKDQGLAIAMKGPRAAIEAMRYHGPLVHAHTIEYQLPGGARHALLAYRKNRKT